MHANAHSQMAADSGSSGGSTARQQVALHLGKAGKDMDMLAPFDQDILAHCALLKEISVADQQNILAAGHERRIAPGEYFFHQGEESNRLYVLMSGQVKLVQVTESGNQVVVGYVGPGGGIGIVVALSSIPYPLSAEAMEHCLAIGWQREEMQALMRRYPQLGLNSLAMVGKRLAQLQEQLQDLATRRVDQRVARTLLRLARQFGKRLPQGVLIDISLTRQSLAEMTGTNLYQVSRIVSSWEKEGIVQSEHQRIIILKAHELVILGEDL
jgi:CRP/FNR family transcriptional regulator, nitrogen oxide reductase regulator